MLVEQTSAERPVLSYLLSVLFVLPVTLFLWLVREALTLANFSLIYTLLILIIAVWLGMGPALLAAIASFFGFNFFLIRPYYTLTVEDPRELLDLFIFLLVAVIASQVASYARRQARAARTRAAEQRLLYDLSSALNQVSDSDNVVSKLREVLQQALGAEAVTLLPALREPVLAETGPQTFAATSYLLLTVGENVYGTLEVTFAKPPSEAQSRLLMACVVQAAMALQRIELVGRVQHSRTLEEADRLKTALLRAVSHDLRTPITIIKSSAGNLRELSDRLPEQERLEMARTIEAEADHLDNLVGNLLDMSRLQAGALVLNQDWNSLGEIAGDVAARAWQLYKVQRVQLIFPDEMPLIYCDYTLMLRALSNILENALRYEPMESRVIIQGEVSQRDSGDLEARVAIVNHGESVPEEDKQAIMEPFYQGYGDSRAGAGRRDGHVGLGLAISRGIVEAHQGRIWLEDTAGGGATFIVALPYDPKEQQNDTDSHG